MTDLQRFEHLFYEIGIEYEKTTLTNERTELDISEESMAHGCGLGVQFGKDGKFYMFVTE